MSHPALRPRPAALLALALALAFSGSAAADARADLHAAFMKNLSAKAYRSTIADLATGKTIATVEYQSPDRFRIVPANGPTTVIAGNNMYVTLNGRAVALPLPAGMMAQYRSDAMWKRMQVDTLITDTGLGAVGAEPARKYHWVSSGKDASNGDVWVSVKTGFVVQVQTAPSLGSKADSVRVSYGDFNSDAIKIAPPK